MRQGLVTVTNLNVEAIGVSEEEPCQRIENSLETPTAAPLILCVPRRKTGATVVYYISFFTISHNEAFGGLAQLVERLLRMQ